MKLNILTLVLGLCLVLQGCTKYEAPSSEAISISESAISAEATGDKYTLSVNAGQASWEAIAEASWLQTETEGSILRVSVEPNYSTESRQAQVKVIAGGQMSAVTVSQQGAPAEAKLFPAEDEVDDLGGLKYFYVSTNTQNWRLESDEAWIQPSANYTKRRAEITVAENSELAPRQGTVRLMEQGTLLGTYTIVQSGIQTFILPFGEFLSNPYEVQAFEKARHSTLVKIPDGFVNSSTYGFTTRSPLFPRVEYTFANNQYVEARLYPASNDIIGQEQYKTKVIDFLKSKSFLFDFANIYVQPDINMEASLVAAKGEVPAYINFRFLPEQPAGMPFFDKFPYGCLDFKPGDEDKIHAYEAANGGTYVPEKSKPGDLYFQTASPSLYRRYYLGDQSVQAFDDYRYAYFFHKGTPYLTREFRKMLAEEGFEMIAKIDFLNMYKYRNVSKGIFLDVWIRNENVAGTMKQVIRFNMRRG